MSVNEKMTALADEVRELSGTTTKKGLDVMISDIDTANNEISGQTDLLAQILAKVNSLPEAGGGSGGGDYDVSTLTIHNNTDYTFFVNGAWCSGQETIIIPNWVITPDYESPGIAMIMLGTTDQTDDKLIMCSYQDGWEDESGEYIEETNSQRLFFTYNEMTGVYYSNIYYGFTGNTVTIWEEV